MNSPPRWAQKLLEVFSDPDTMEEVQGDLLELYDHWVQTIGKRRADWRYSRSTLKLLRPLAQTNTTQYPSPFFLNPAMIRNYFRTAWRNLVKNKFYSFINISGLTVGLAVGILILLWVQDELSFDRFHTQSSSIYRLENWAGTGSSRQIWTATVAPIAGFAKRETPEVKDAVRLTENYAYTLFKYREKTISEHKTFFTDPTLFSVFDFNLIQGNPAKPFPNNNSIVVTETTAKRYFGDENPIGKVLAANDNTAFTVSGVIRDFPKNSSIQGDMFLPMSLFFKNIRLVVMVTMS
ncbi:permease prefix domain 2-containing transporter [Spirosoma utsteinense]|uniref:permease prefix domain 2-containing transporter n=1 Tax=Spirosoma utsteinense TaxID=2585773 RepID=UPI001EB1DDE7|nr:permease prefix domain 2-containing transporter [Spirosoma utsteinense]MBC3785132.1 hypothetical protein [Spirosoma utsteinense]